MGISLAGGKKMYSGFIREIDSVGRIVIPKQFRKELDIDAIGSKVELFCDGKQITCRKAVDACVFCKSESELTEFEGQYVCKTCLEKLKAE